MRRIGIFADVSNLYYCISKRYNGRKLDYRKYYGFVRDLGEIIQAVAYGAQANNEAAAFIHALKNTGFQVKYKDASRHSDWDVGITVDVINMAPRLDIVVLGSADRDLEPLVNWCQQRGVDVYVIACGISKELKEQAAEVIEIPESLLEEPKHAAPKTEGQSVPTLRDSDAPE